MQKNTSLAGPLRFVALSAVNTRENSYKPHMLRKYTSLATFLLLTAWQLRPMFIQSCMVSSETNNIRTSSVAWLSALLV